MAEELKGQTPIFGGSTGGLLTKADVEEKYAITWTSPKEQVFEMPTGGAAVMRKGENLLYLARKEYGLALGGQQLRKMKINDYKIYRIYPNGDVEYLHPKDGVFPEKSNEGRPYVGKRDRTIGENPSPSQLKFSGTAPTTHKLFVDKNTVYFYSPSLIRTVEGVFYGRRKSSVKPIRLSAHALGYTTKRGFTVAEVEQAIRSSSWEVAEQGRLQCRKDFAFNQEWNHKIYATKQVNPVFVEEETEIVVITVYTYYF